MDKSKFEQQIKEYEDIMFGLMLYQQTSPKWVQLVQQTSYKNMRRRGKQAIEEAKSILSAMKQGKDVQDRIMCFEFPIILDDMRFRIEIMLQSYEELYPERQREMKLSEKEITALRNEAMSRN